MQDEVYRSIADGLAAELTRRQGILGDSFFKSKEAWAMIYPVSMEPHEYKDGLVIARVMDKLFSIGRTPKGTSTDKYWEDILGLVMLRLSHDVYYKDEMACGLEGGSI